MPLLNYIEFAGIHAGPSFASEGTAFLNSLSALMTGQLKQIGFRDAGAASLIPSCASFRIWFIHPLIQSNLEGTCRTRLGCSSGRIHQQTFISLSSSSTNSVYKYNTHRKRGRRILLINQQGRRPLFVSKSCFFFDFSGF